jgi:hypothetical protein
MYVYDLLISNDINVAVGYRRPVAANDRWHPIFSSCEVHLRRQWFCMGTNTLIVDIPLYWKHIFTSFTTLGFNAMRARTTVNVLQ